MIEVLAGRVAKATANVQKNEKARTAAMGRFLAGMANLADRLELGEVPQTDWEDHELAWQSYVSDLRIEVVRLSAKAMLALEAVERDEPGTLSGDAAEQLYWWLEEGGREQYLGQLPIEVRRKLEAEAK
jgi:hypothetical protein